jgi:hypothetical protein
MVAPLRHSKYRRWFIRSKCDLPFERPHPFCAANYGVLRRELPRVSLRLVGCLRGKSGCSVLGLRRPWPAMESFSLAGGGEPHCNFTFRPPSDSAAAGDLVIWRKAQDKVVWGFLHAAAAQSGPGVGDILDDTIDTRPVAKPYPTTALKLPSTMLAFFARHGNLPLQSRCES